MRRLFFPLSIFSVFCFQTFAQVTSTEGLLKEMHKKYKGQFYRHITYVQLNKIFSQGVAARDTIRLDTLQQVNVSQQDSLQPYTVKTEVKFETSIWYEAFEYPGKARVDFGPTIGQNGYIFIRDTIFYFKDGEFECKEPMVNESMLLSGDIYCIPIPNILSKLTVLGYDVTKFHENKWKDRPVYVVGALEGDDTTRQFWIDKQFLYIVRRISNENGRRQEIQFSEYQAKGKFFIEDEVKIMDNGKLVKTERYAEVNPDILLLPSIFDPNQWGKVHWKTK